MSSKETGNPGLYPVKEQWPSPIDILAEPSLAKFLRFYLWSPVKEMLHFQSLPLPVSQSPQFRCPLSRFPSQSLFKERDAALR